MDRVGLCCMLASRGNGHYMIPSREERTEMKSIIRKLHPLVKALKKVDGQDLIEYALLVALIAFAATAGMSTLAKDINTAFGNIGSTLTSYTGAGGGGGGGGGTTFL